MQLPSGLQCYSTYTHSVDDSISICPSLARQTQLPLGKHLTTHQHEKDGPLKLPVSEKTTT